jgi:hypothetical protein
VQSIQHRRRLQYAGTEQLSYAESAERVTQQCDSPVGPSKRWAPICGLFPLRGDQARDVQIRGYFFGLIADKKKIPIR